MKSKKAVFIEVESIIVITTDYDGTGEREVGLLVSHCGFMGIIGLVF